jgi:hypothetical protein
MEAAAMRRLRLESFRVKMAKEIPIVLADINGLYQHSLQVAVEPRSQKLDPPIGEHVGCRSSNFRPCIRLLSSKYRDGSATGSCVKR